MRLFGLLLALASSVYSVNPTHYGNPYVDNCQDGEVAVQIQDVPGAFCTSSCDPECPMDTPEGSTATPTCALQTTSGDRYCALICTPRHENECGSGACHQVNPLVGVCTYTYEIIATIETTER